MHYPTAYSIKMALFTSGRLGRYYGSFSDVSVSFNRKIIDFIGLLTREIFFRISGLQVRCVLYSSSMTGAKLLANLDETHFEKLKECGGKITLHFAFATPSKGLPITFFVSSRVVGFRPYQTKNPNTNLVSIEYGQKPPDQLDRDPRPSPGNHEERQSQERGANPP